MPAKDGRRNALVKEQRWEELVYIDVKSMDDYINAMCRGKYSIYGFSGQSLQGTIRIDWRKETNANWIGDFFVILDEIKDSSVDVFVVDPIFEIHYNPNVKVWEKAIRTGKMPESTRHTPYFGHNNKWQQAVLGKVKPGGLMISKRNIANVNLTQNPQMFYVHDARPSAFIVRIDHK